MRNLSYPKTLAQHVVVSLKGFVMGCADVIPGVSGGTMALIMGIYEELIHSVTQFSRVELYDKLFRGQFRLAAEQAGFSFLVALAVGVIAAVLGLARILAHLLETNPQFVYSFFFGLILASIWVVAKFVTTWDASKWASFALGAVGAFVLVGLTPADTPEAPWFIFLSGALAICALVVPGISGSFILLLLGKYAFVLGAVNDRNLTVIAVFALGALVGLLSFVRVLHYLLEHYYSTLMALLAGFLLGSLRKIWPWQMQLEGLELTRNVLPPAGTEPLYALLLASLGIGIVLALSWQGEKAERA